MASVANGARGCNFRHAAINDIILHSLKSAGVPSQLEPSGLLRSDGKRPDGISIAPWKCGRCLVWDATCPDTYAPSHRVVAAQGAGVVAQQAEDLKRSKYVHLESKYDFVPVAVETSGVFGPDARSFMKELGHRLYQATLDPNSQWNMIQQVSVAVQRGNAVAVQRGNAVAVLGSMDKHAEELNNYFFLSLQFLLFLLIWSCFVLFLFYVSFFSSFLALVAIINNNTIFHNINNNNKFIFSHILPCFVFCSSVSSFVLGFLVFFLSSLCLLCHKQ